MERRIDLDAPLDYIELQIFPSHNRYEACVSTSNTAEKVASGDLQELLLHLPQVKDLSSKNSNSNFKILAPEDVNDTDWFTTDTLRRFLLVVGSPDILTIGNEISQLEETRKFQLSLFAKAEFDMTSSFESKNELLRTVDLRFSELKEKLSDTLHQATGNKCSPKDISNIENLAHHLGAENIRDSLQKLLEPSQLKDSITERNIHIPNSQSQLSPPVKYGVSPAKAAQIERQLSTDSESENSFSSEEEDNQPPPIERSRTPARPSAASRRSASPMRRIQIGRGGPRRPTVLNIKSLNYPKSGTQRDGSESGQSSQEEEDEKSERLAKLRMSVQDKISLFESKKKDEGVEIQKPKTVQIQKAVLRRWSSGMSESHEPSPPPPPLVTAKDAEKTESPSPKKKAVDDHEKDVVSSWSEQKEAELNQLFNKMMETKTKIKPVRRHSVTNDNSKSKSKEQRGGFYENYKQKRDEKLRKEVGKRAEKEAQLQEMEKQLLDGKKAEIVSINNNKPKPQNPQKKLNQLPNPKKESPKAVKKITNKPPPSQLPATRKSWPSAPSPKPTVTPTTRKPQSATPAVRPNPITKSEKPKPQSKTLKVTTQPEPKTTRTKPVIDKKPATVTKSAPKPRTKAATPTATATKKVIKKSSVVPVETKPFLRKGTGGGGAVVIKSKLAAQVSTEEAPVQDKAVVVETSNECEPPPKLEEALPETCNEFDIGGDDVAESVHEVAKRESCNEIDVVEEELMISPSAWVERETDEIVVCEERCVQVSSPRVRHSLFQMLLEETGEGESGEWGNAQIPHPHPSVHKDTHAPPKGFKRLLKFARKTKADLLLTDSSSPSTIFRRG